MSCSLVQPSEGHSLPSGPLGTALAGTLVSSLHRLKDTDNADGAFFVFGDLSIKIEGTFRLQFNLYEMRDKECFHMQSIQSEPFVVHAQKNFPGMSESTFLTRSFSDQGVRLRLRKEPRTLLRKRGPASEDYQPRRYNRQQSQGGDRQATESQDSPRQNQAEKAETMQLPIHSTPYDSRQQMGRAYSQSTSGYSDDTSNKRPRTGSEHSSNFSQHQSLDSPQYPQRGFTENLIIPFAGQQQAYGYQYTQSPQSSSMSPRSQYFAQRLNTQADNSSYDPNSQRSPQAPFFPHQAQNIRYPQSQSVLIPSPPQRTQSAQSFDGLGIHARTQISPAMQATGMTNMHPPIHTYGRMNTAPPYGPINPSSYGEYPTTGAMVDNYLRSRGPSMSTTTAPGP